MKTEMREDTCGDGRWSDLHEWFLSEARGKEADVVFLGDDHIALLEQSQVYHELFAPLHCLCFGALGEKMSNLLWRVDHSILCGLAPKVIVVSIGNADNDISKEELLDGMKLLADNLKAQLPDAKVFFLKLLPSGRRVNKRRDFVNEVNVAMDGLLDGVAEVIDVDPIYDSSGVIDVHDMFDFAHLTHEGYRKVFEPVFLAVSEALEAEL